MFGHDTTQALQAAATLVNTGRLRDGTDALAVPDDVTRFITAYEYSSRHDGDQAEVDQVRATRERLAQLWGADRDDAAELVNAMLADGGVLPRLVRHGRFDWHLHVVDADAPLARQILVETAMALVDVIRDDQVDRLRTCAGEGCTAVLVDLSRNSSRRYCDVNNCGNRAHVEAYRARRAGAQTQTQARAGTRIGTPGQV